MNTTAKAACAYCGGSRVKLQRPQMRARFRARHKRRSLVKTLRLRQYLPANDLRARDAVAEASDFPASDIQASDFMAHDESSGAGAPTKLVIRDRKSVV